MKNTVSFKYKTPKLDPSCNNKINDPNTTNFIYKILNNIYNKILIIKGGLIKSR